MSIKKRWGVVREAVRGSCNVYGAQFVSTGACAGGIVAGGTGSKEVKVFGPPTSSGAVPEPLGAYKVPSGVHGLHVNPLGTLIGVAAVDGSVYAVQMPKPKGGAAAAADAPATPPSRVKPMTNQQQRAGAVPRARGAPIAQG